MSIRCVPLVWLLGVGCVWPATDVQARQLTGPTAPTRDAARGRPVTGTASISGVVSSGSGAAAGARVMLTGDQAPIGRTTSSDERGRFSFDNLPAGRYYVTVYKPGYLNASPGQRRPQGAPSPIVLGDGEAKQLAISLVKAGVITGTIVDHRGEPAIGTNVRLLQHMPMGGERRWQPTGNGATDDRGVFRLHSLQPGDYMVCAVPRDMAGPASDEQRVKLEIERMREMLTASTRAPVGPPREAMQSRLADLEAQLKSMPVRREPALGYAPTCFPGGVARAVIKLGPAEERSGIDFELQRATVAQVEGVVLGAPAPTQEFGPGVQLRLVNRDDSLGPADMNFARMSPTGRFSFANIAPGSYRIVAQAQRIGGPEGSPPKVPAMWGSIDLDVAGEDVTGLVVEMRRGVALSGRLIIDSTAPDAPSDLAKVQVSVFPSRTSGFEIANSAQAFAEADGRFTLSDILPGRYRFSVGTGPKWMLQSAVLDGTDLLDFPLELDGRRDISDIVLTVTDRISEITGSVSLPDGKPAADHTVVIFPSEERYWVPDSRRVQVSRVDSAGKFTLRRLPPGTYGIATVLDPEPGSWSERAFLEQLAGTATLLTIGEGEKKVQDLRVRR